MSTWDQTFTLNTGAKIPAVGLGTWQSPPGQVEKSVQWALEAGYRHIDGAAIYNNEEEVGNGIKASSVPREHIFLTTKLWNNARARDDVEKALDESLRRLQTTYVDLYLIHWPVAFKSSPSQFPRDATGAVELADIPVGETWAALEALVAKGKARAIGISNFNERRTDELLRTATIVPAVNQIEAHPFLQQPALMAYMASKGIHVTAYSPLGQNIYGKPAVINDAGIAEIAKEAGLTPAQVLIAWAVRRGTSVVPKSVTRERIIKNFEKVELSDEIFAKVNALDKGLRYNDPVEWGYDVFDTGADVVAAGKAGAKKWLESQKK